MQNTGTAHQNFRSLIVWEKSHLFSLRIYAITGKFPPLEQYGLTNQMRRAAVSVTSNIAEGYGRMTPKDKAHFYTMSCGSVRELQSQLSLAKDLKYISPDLFDTLDLNAEEILRLLNGLLKSTKSTN